MAPACMMDAINVSDVWWRSGLEDQGELEPFHRSLNALSSYTIKTASSSIGVLMVSFRHARKIYIVSWGQDIKRESPRSNNKMCEIYGISVPTTVRLMIILCMKSRRTLTLAGCVDWDKICCGNESFFLWLNINGLNAHTKPRRKRKSTRNSFYWHSLDSEEADETFFE